MEELLKLFKSGEIEEHELEEGVRLYDKAFSEEISNYIDPQRRVRNKKALKNTLLANNSEAYVEWLFEHYYNH